MTDDDSDPDLPKTEVSGHGIREQVLRPNQLSVLENRQLISQQNRTYESTTTK